jgi:teichoic acid transport system permease protein
VTETVAIVLEELPPPVLDPEYAELGGVPMAAKYGLKQSGKRPPLFEYSRLLWQRRHFITGYATAKNRSLYSGARLGQIWQLLTPILNVAVYYFVFGILFTQSRGVPKFLLFLVIGVFLFNFLQTSMINGSRSISDQLVLIRALHFPRACLPLSATIIQFQQLGFSMIIVVLVALGNGELPAFKWLLVIPAVLLLGVFANGMGMIVARSGSVLTDTAQLLPFISRTWMYLCGVMYSLSSVTDKAGIPHWLKDALYYDPPALFITVVRNCMIKLPAMPTNLGGAPNFNAAVANCAQTTPSIPKNICDPITTFHSNVEAMHQPGAAWLGLVIWALVFGVGGYVYFWKAEEQYGRG